MASTSDLKISPYEMLGADEGVRRLVDRFYCIMDAAPQAQAIRAMHAGDLAPMRERLFDFMSGWLGGPSRYLQRADAKCIVSAHQPFAIGSAESEQWMYCMERALEETGASAEVRGLLIPALRRMAGAFRNR